MRSALLSLAFGNFVIGSGALVFIGMLDAVAKDLDVSVAAAGAGIGGLVLSAELVQPAARALPYVGLPGFALALWVSISAQRRLARRW